MSVLSRDDFFKAISSKITGTEEDDLKVIEDLTDTYNSLEKQSHGDGINWEQKYHELDDTWSKRYRSRFFSSNGASEIIEDDEPGDDAQASKRKKTDHNITINDLFENKNKK